MAQRLLLVNPRKGGARPSSTPTAKRRTKANGSTPMAARRKTPRRNAKGRFVKGSTARTTTRRKAPAKRRTRRNPVSRAPARRASPVRRRRAAAPVRRRTRRNPIARGKVRFSQVVRELLIPSAWGAAGAIATDTLFTYLPLPAQLKAPGLARYASKGATAVAMTMLVAMTGVVKRQSAVQMGVGALTCLSAEVARNFLAENFPAAAPAVMEGMGYYNPALPAGSGSPEMGLYVQGGGNVSQFPNLSNAQGGMGLYENADAYAYSS